MWSSKFIFITILVFNLLVFTNSKLVPPQALASVKPESATKLADRAVAEVPDNCPEDKEQQPDHVCRVVINENEWH
ncbi:unnamed protein product [Arctia plantaginis]|uniref:Uncharacterized protein n=1 Tax=Arctia plantaginis TaxID=874455 RepID=A0A8S1B6U1_ARCPL|nr:unnamed protein product [Arctia plantaginis]